MSLILGIDLGTTNSCIAVYRNGKVKIIASPDDEKANTIPSFVFYDKNHEILVGKTAAKRAVLNKERGIYDSKRFLGLKFNHESVKENLERWNFKVAEDPQGECEILIPSEEGEEELRIRPEEVSAKILRKLKENAEKELNERIFNVVITCPAYFTNSQRQATKDAARIAGLNVLKLMAEPTAAALAFAQENDKKDRLILVYDLGGGTFDVSLIKTGKNNKVKVLGVSGNNHLGGRDFDKHLSSHILKEAQEKYNITISSMNKRRIMRRLEREAEEVKKLLTEVESADFELYELEGKNIHISVTRQAFEHINKKLFDETMATLDELLAEHNIKDKKKIDEVLLVGGSTRIPKIYELVKEYFGGKEPNKTVNPDEAVAIGAAIKAAMLSDHPSQMCSDFKISDVTPHSLGIEVIARDTMSVVIQKNAQIPCIVKKTYYTHFDFQTATTIRVFEGESKNVAENTLLGEFTIEGITAKPRGQVKFEVKFELDLDGILNVTATESSRNMVNNLRIVLSNGRLTEDDIRRLRDDRYHHN